MNTDTVADLLTRIRNARLRHSEKVSLPHSCFKEEIVRLLKSEGYLKDYKVVTQDDKKSLTVYLKYGADGSCVINELVRVSKPGRRVYCKASELPKVRDGLGIALISTPKGLMSNKECKKLKVGGEVVCYVF